MPGDPLYEALQPFHQWARVAAVCACVLAASACAVLAVSRRLSGRWWLGLGVLTLCLLAVAFGARARGAAEDLRPVAVGCLPPPGVSGCDIWLAWIVTAQQRAVFLGVALVIISALAVVVAAIALVRWRRLGGEPRPSPVAVGLALSIFVAGFAVFQLASSVARWIETARLADIRNAGDGLGMLPLIYAIFGTLVSGLVLLAGLVAVIACTLPRRVRPENASSPSLPE